MFAFQYLKRILRKSVKKYPFFLSQKEADVSNFIEIQG